MALREEDALTVLEVTGKPQLWLRGGTARECFNMRQHQKKP